MLVALSWCIWMPTSCLLEIRVYLLLVFALFILENDSFVGHAIGSDI
jgi:hypothetical protein